MCWHTLIGGASEECEPVWCDSEDPLFILYTSGSTGKPKVDPPNNPVLLELLKCVICFSYTALICPSFSHTLPLHQGVLHTVSGYMLYTAATFKLVFDYHSDDVYWCTADIGWITGHSYITYGPMANGATSVLVRGTS